VQVLRSGLRSVAYGRGHSNLLDLRFVAPNADIQVGDVLVTSGLDGVYPAGLAVAKVIQVESVGQGAFGRVVCQPLAGIDRNRQLLIVMSNSPAPPRPLDEPAKAASASKKNLPKMEPIAAPPLPATPLPPQAPAATAAGTQQAPAQSGAPATSNAATPAHQSAASPAVVPPGAARPGTPHPAAPQPAITRPAGTQPPAVRPPVVRPPAATPATTQPATTQPGVTQPAATPPVGARKEGQ
jgi:rod shape-determining protein MreC